jgi:hypothetical protein
MIADLLPWIEDGITIHKWIIGKDSWYEVFTIPTQYFIVISLNELTLERFEFEVERQKKHEKMQKELMKLSAYED